MPSGQKLVDSTTFLLSANSLCNNVLMFQSSDVSVVKRNGERLQKEMTECDNSK